MTGFSCVAVCGLALALGGCGGPAAPTPAPKPQAAAAGTEQVTRIVEKYWDDRLPAENGISPQYLADSLSIEDRYLAEILPVPRDALDAKTRLTYDIFRRRREVIVEGFTYPSELLPIDPIDGMTHDLAAYAAEFGAPPSTKSPNSKNWIKRTEANVR